MSYSQNILFLNGYTPTLSLGDRVFIDAFKVDSLEKFAMSIWWNDQDLFEYTFSLSGLILPNGLYGSAREWAVSAIESNKIYPHLLSSYVTQNSDRSHFFEISTAFNYVGLCIGVQSGGVINNNVKFYASMCGK